MKNLHDFNYPAANPSLLAAKKDSIKEEILFAQESGARFIHIDVMDGKFVPNLSFSLDFVKEIHSIHHMVNDVHLMIEKPYLYVGEYARSGADIVTFHLEACSSKEEVIQTINEIKSNGALAGISIKPKTPVKSLLPYLEMVDLVLLMSVEPGKGGQAFIANSLDRLDELTIFLAKIDKNVRPIVEIDGGINENTFIGAINHGAELLVAGSYLYGHSGFKERLQQMEKGGQQ